MRAALGLTDQEAVRPIVPFREPPTLDTECVERPWIQRIDLVVQPRDRRTPHHVLDVPAHEDVATACSLDAARMPRISTEADPTANVPTSTRAVAVTTTVTIARRRRSGSRESGIGGVGGGRHPGGRGNVVEPGRRCCSA